MWGNVWDWLGSMCWARRWGQDGGVERKGAIKASMGHESALDGEDAPVPGSCLCPPHFPCSPAVSGLAEFSLRLLLEARRGRGWGSPSGNEAKWQGRCFVPCTMAIVPLFPWHLWHLGVLILGHSVLLPRYLVTCRDICHCHNPKMLRSPSGWRPGNS